MVILSFCNDLAKEREWNAYFIVCFCLVAVTSSASLPSCALIGLWYVNVAFSGQTHFLGVGFLFNCTTVGQASDSMAALT